MSLHYANYDPADRAGWLAMRNEFRKRGVGGSEIASVAGIPGAFGSAYSEWADRTGKLPKKERESAYLEDGRDIEAIVAKRFETASGLKIRHRYAIITNDACPHLFADVDGFVDNEDMGWEGKTYDPRSDKFRDGCPATYVSQVQVYMAVTGKRRWVLSAWSYGQGTKHFYFTLDGADEKPAWAEELIKMNQAEIDAAEEVAAQFMRQVENGIPPFPDGSEATGETLKEMYPEASPGTTKDLEAWRSDLDAIEGIDARIKELERERDSHKQAIMEAMGDAETATATGWKISYKNTETRRLDAKKALETVGGVILEPCYKTTRSRVLRITKAK